MRGFICIGRRQIKRRHFYSGQRNRSKLKQFLSSNSMPSSSSKRCWKASLSLRQGAQDTSPFALTTRYQGISVAGSRSWSTWPTRRARRGRDKPLGTSRHRIYRPPSRDFNHRHSSVNTPIGRAGCGGWPATVASRLCAKSCARRRTRSRTNAPRLNCANGPVKRHKRRTRISLLPPSAETTLQAISPSARLPPSRPRPTSRPLRAAASKLTLPSPTKLARTGPSATVTRPVTRSPSCVSR
jgi:hypothetical protein